MGWTTVKHRQQLTTINIPIKLVTVATHTQHRRQRGNTSLETHLRSTGQNTSRPSPVHISASQGQTTTWTGYSKGGPELTIHLRQVLQFGSQPMARRVPVRSPGWEKVSTKCQASCLQLVSALTAAENTI